MAYQPAPIVCSLPAYEPFMPLAGFPPARGYCSTTALLDKRTDHSNAGPFTPREFQCPAEYNYMCDLLSELKGSDQEFARTMCCCIGVCPGSQPTAHVTVSSTTPSDATTESGTSTPEIALSTTLNAESNTLTRSTSEASTISSTSDITISNVSTEPRRTFYSSPLGPSPQSTSPSGPSALGPSLPGPSPSDPSPSGPSAAGSSRPGPSRPGTSPQSTSPQGTSLSFSSTSSTSSDVSSTPSSDASSSTPSSSSSSTATCPTSITADPSCTSITPSGTTTFSQYYSGQYMIESTNNAGNDYPADYPPIYESTSGTLDMCSAASNCADLAVVNRNPPYYSFDLHYLASNATWECVLYYDPNTDPAAFNVEDSDACLSFGFSHDFTNS